MGCRTTLAGFTARPCRELRPLYTGLGAVARRSGHRCHAAVWPAPIFVRRDLRPRRDPPDGSFNSSASNLVAEVSPTGCGILATRRSRPVLCRIHTNNCFARFRLTSLEPATPASMVRTQNPQEINISGRYSTSSPKLKCRTRGLGRFAPTSTSSRRSYLTCAHSADAPATRAFLPLQTRQGQLDQLIDELLLHTAPSFCDFCTLSSDGRVRNKTARRIQEKAPRLPAWTNIRHSPPTRIRSTRSPPSC